jgi:hypothetical protein
MRFGTLLLACESFRRETMGEEVMVSLELDARTILLGSTSQ